MEEDVPLIQIHNGHATLPLSQHGHSQALLVPIPPPTDTDVAGYPQAVSRFATMPYDAHRSTRLQSLLTRPLPNPPPTSAPKRPRVYVNHYQSGPLAYTASMPALRAPTGSLFGLGQLRAAAHAAAAVDGTVFDDEYGEAWSSSTGGSSRPPSRPLLINSSQSFLSGGEAIPEWMRGMAQPSMSSIGAGLALPALAQAPLPHLGDLLPQQQQYHPQPQQQPHVHPSPPYYHYEQHAQQQHFAPTRAPPQPDPLTEVEKMLDTFETKAWPEREKDIDIEKAIVGQGTYCSVQFGVMRGTGDKVAVKTLIRKTLPMDMLVFLSDYALTRAMEHNPGLVKAKPVVYYKHDGGDGYDMTVIQERGLCDMRGWMRGKAPGLVIQSPEDVKDLVIQMTLGPLHMHKDKYMHRDLKPDNFIVMTDNTVKLTDLGLARKLGFEEVAHSHTGTPEYMAPEMSLGKYDLRVDVFAFGIVLYEILTRLNPRVLRRQINLSSKTNTAEGVRLLLEAHLRKALLTWPDGGKLVTGTDSFLIQLTNFILACVTVPYIKRPCLRTLLRTSPLLQTELYDQHNHPFDGVTPERFESARKLVKEKLDGEYGGELLNLLHAMGAPRGNTTMGLDNLDRMYVKRVLSTELDQLDKVVIKTEARRMVMALSELVAE